MKSKLLRRAAKWGLGAILALILLLELQVSVLAFPHLVIREKVHFGTVTIHYV